MLCDVGERCKAACEFLFCFPAQELLVCYDMFYFFNIMLSTRFFLIVISFFVFFCYLLAHEHLILAYMLVQTWLSLSTVLLNRLSGGRHHFGNCWNSALADDYALIFGGRQKRSSRRPCGRPWLPVTLTSGRPAGSPVPSAWLWLKHVNTSANVLAPPLCTAVQHSTWMHTFRCLLTCIQAKY